MSDELPDLRPYHQPSSLISNRDLSMGNESSIPQLAGCGFRSKALRKDDARPRGQPIPYSSFRLSITIFKFVSSWLDRQGGIRRHQEHVLLLLKDSNVGASDDKVDNGIEHLAYGSTSGMIHAKACKASLTCSMPFINVPDVWYSSGQVVRPHWTGPSTWTLCFRTQQQCVSTTSYPSFCVTVCW